MIFHWLLYHGCSFVDILISNDAHWTPEGHILINHLRRGKRQMNRRDYPYRQAYNLEGQNLIIDLDSGC